MEQKGINILVDADFYKKIKIHLAENDMKLKEYIVSLISKDLGIK